MNEPQWIRSLRFDFGYLFQELWLLCKHPTRKATYHDISYHWSKIWDTLIFHPWYCLKRGIHNIWHWGWQIWGLDSWDYFFLTDMMEHQLKDMEELWEKTYVVHERKYEDTGDGMEKGFRCQHRRIWKRIRWTRKLMKMWRDEHYSMEAYDQHHQLFPEREGIFGKSKVCKVDEYGIPILYECEPMSEDARADYSMRSEKARIMDEKVFKLWYTNLRFIRNWWE